MNKADDQNSLEQTPILSVRGIHKEFPGVVANDRIDLDFYQGEVHAVLGENGAGKSTLMKIISGIYQQDRGSIWIDGSEVNINSPKDAFAHGIGMVHQNLAVIDSLSVLENVILGVKGALFTLNLEEIREQLNGIAGKYHIELPFDARVGDLSVGLQQRVEILRMLYRQFRVIIFDEPTTFLTPQEVERLGEIISDLAKEGRTVIYITHKLQEVLSFSDRVSVMRDGKLVSTKTTSSVNEDKLVELMIGRKIADRKKKLAENVGEPALHIKELYAKNDLGAGILKGISLSVMKGEILGLAGVTGNGQQELTEVIAGLRPYDQGSVIVGDLDIYNVSPLEIIDSGLSFIPGDRLRMGLVASLPVEDNLILKSYREEPVSAGVFLNKDAVKQITDRLVDEYQIKVPQEKLPVKLLSGGNQQKVILARELSAPHKLLIAEQPTSGLDIQSTGFIHQLLLNEREKGTAVLLISSDLDEIFELSDRIAVIFEGRIMAVLNADEVDKLEVGKLMAGRNQEK